MECDAAVDIFVPAVLTVEEFNSIPENVRDKVCAFAGEKVQECLVTKALLESNKFKYEQELHNIQNEFLQVQIKLSENENHLKENVQELELLRKRWEAAQTEMKKLKETVTRLESENDSYRQQRDLAVNKQNELFQLLDRRNKELENVKGDLELVSSQLQSAITSKCEALVKAEEVESKELALSFKENRLSQERELLNSQIAILTEQVYQHTHDLMTLRREHSAKLVDLEADLMRKSEEAQLLQIRCDELSENNVSLLKKLDEQLETIREQRQDYVKLQDTYNQELQSQNRLVDLYKDASADAESKATELTEMLIKNQAAMKELREEKENLQAEIEEEKKRHEAILKTKEDHIVELQKEIEKANELMIAMKQATIDSAIEEISPEAANVSRILKSGFSLTQIYMQYAETASELAKQKEENHKLNFYIEKIIEEIEVKAPLLKRQRQDFELALEDTRKLQTIYTDSLKEIHRLEDQLAEVEKQRDMNARENNKLKAERVDLSRQVIHLLKEVEVARAGYRGSAPKDIQIENVANADQAISENLITFGSVEELQANNARLIALVRKLSAEDEEKEVTHGRSYGNLLADFEKCKNELKDLREMHERSVVMNERIIRQCEAYKTMYHNLLTNKESDPGAVPMDVSSIQIPRSQETATVSASTRSTINEDDDEVNELKTKIEELEKELKSEQDEFNTYRIEKQTSENMLTEQMERMRDELHNLHSVNAKLLSQVEYHDERTKVIQGNIKSYKTQISALETKNKIYNSTIVKHEQSILTLKETAVSAQNRLSLLEVSLENARQEVRLLKEREARYKAEKEVFQRERQSQSVLLANINSIKATLERSEAEGRLKIESRMEEALRECNSLRRRLQEEQDHFRELADQLQRQTDTAKEREQEERELCLKARKDLEAVRKQLEEKEAQLDELFRKLSTKDSAKDTKTIIEIEDMVKQIKILEVELADKKAEVESYKNQLDVSEKCCQQYTDMCKSMEEQLKSMSKEYEEYKQNMEKKLNDTLANEKSLREQVDKLEADVSCLTSGSLQASSQLTLLLNRAKDDLKKQQEIAENAKTEAINVRAEVSSLQASLREAEEKYAQQVSMHSLDLKALTAIKEEVTQMHDQIAELQSAKQKAEEALGVGQSAWQSNEVLLKSELAEAQERISELDKQNALLYVQIEELGNQLAVVKVQGTPAESGDSPNVSFSSSFTEDEKSVDQLRQIIKHLRKEKDIAVSKYDVFSSENLRLKTQNESLQKQLDEQVKFLEAEKGKTEVEQVTLTKHSDLTRKLDTLNAVTDSNRILRNERDNLQVQLNQYRTNCEKLEQEIIPLAEQNKELTARTDALEAENFALRGEAGRLRQRVAYLLERSNKASPEDLRRLQQEKDALNKLLTSEKEAHQRAQEELRSLRPELNTLREKVRVQGDELKTLHERVTKLTQELAETRTLSAKRQDELAKITEDLGAKEALLTELRSKEITVRKIAKKYKAQFEELSATLEQERKKVEEEKKQAIEAAVSAAASEISPEVKEQLREEGRKEVVTQNTSQLKELSDRVATCQLEVENLHKENESLKEQNNLKATRAKQVLNNAREKIAMLTSEKEDAEKRLNEALEKLGSRESDKVEESSASVKTHYEARIKRMEKEIFDLRNEKQHEAELLNQKISQLQRQLEKIQGSKPSTSSGSSDKTTSEPPTANIKPMAGQPSGTKPTQIQQSASVTPWSGRGDTPFASIRPMSLQTRTAAVLPTSQSNSSSSQSTSQGSTILLPPQHQIVHSSGPEVLSSSPTSSHTDYMPATSSATTTVRQVTVQPTVTVVTPHPQPAAESTQDGEAESADAEGQQVPVLSSPLMQQPTQQQVVALVLPRVEQQQQQQSTAPETPSSQASTSSNTVTTTQAGLKRPREAETDSSDNDLKTAPQGKRTRVTATQDVFQPVSSESTLEVEYQVPTSSQRDQEDDITECDSAEDEEGMADDGALATYDEGEGPDIDAENTPDQENNEVEIMEDSNEVPNQSGGPSVIDSNAGSSSSSVPAELQPPEATSSGTSGRSIPTLSRLVGYEDGGDDSIVPSTPTLYVPRRTDGFGEAVSSPQVPQGRFTFSETNPPTTRAGVAQVASEGMDDTRMDLTQLEDSGTGRSVPSTPLQVSPQGEVGPNEACPSAISEGDQEMSSEPEPASGSGTIPSITVTEAADDETQIEVEDKAEIETEPNEAGDNQELVEEHGEHDNSLEQAEEGGDGVSSEGEKPQTVEEIEEGREAEASEEPSVSSNTRSAVATRSHRRPGRPPFRGRGRPASRPTPIVWNDPGSSPSPSRGRGGTVSTPGRGNFVRGMNPRARRLRSKSYQLRY